MHLDQEGIQRFLHGELSDDDAREAKAHLESCEACEILVDQAQDQEEEIFGVLKNLDHHLPEPDLGRILARGKRTASHPVRWAAGIALALGFTSVAYAAPGSPLPGLLDRVVDRLRPSVLAPENESIRRPTEAATSGVVVVPGAAFSVRFSSHQDSDHAAIELVDGNAVAIRALYGSPEFTYGIDEVLVDNEDPGTNFELEIPHSATRVVVLVEGDTVFVKDGNRITAPVRMDADGRYLLSLGRPGT